MNQAIKSDDDDDDEEEKEEEEVVDSDRNKWTEINSGGDHPVQQQKWKCGENYIGKSGGGGGEEEMELA